MKHFDIKTHIYFGENSLDRLADIPYRNALLVADKFVVSSGLIHLITVRLQQNDVAWQVFDDVVPDPPLEKIALGAQAVLQQRPDVLIAIGGGSAIDSAKAIREVSLQLEPSYARPALIAIPTTSGTGTEVTSFSVVSDPENCRKMPLVSDSMLPDEAILDAEL
ncbi:MAG: iron-containing alcohol dehydrogenase, partial [Clostridia bacterium]|nr:iron-containing alcohol dehydrogenase [Clostridia bacterium]